jgi:serine/threonine-protein kinase HipA
VADVHVEVLVALGDEEVLAGDLWSHRRREESATFSYATGFLAYRHAYELDPMLPLRSGQQQTPIGRAIFGAFSDCAPDRWGRRLVQRAEPQRVRDHGGAERSFGEIDYLLGVRDDLRQGAVRLRDPASGAYLADERHGVPALLDLPALLGAADRLDRDDAGEADIELLLRGGSSLGGARPKAHVRQRGGRLGIAKFPSPSNDEWDVIRWEAVALALAGAAGIAIPGWELHTVEGKAVLIVDRFDRIGDRRIAYASAMTMLEASDREERSYLEIAEVIANSSPDAGADLRELWRRIAFSILIANTDDHLRNHGFLRVSSAGWSLSPAFDLNPDPRPGERHLSTAIDDATTAARVDVLLDVAAYFRLRPDDARHVLREVVNATSKWREAAAEQGLDRSAIEDMAPAFEHDQAREASALTSSLAHPQPPGIRAR